MPYIEGQANRMGLAFGSMLPKTPGELNYILTVRVVENNFSLEGVWDLMTDYIERKGKNYTVLNEVMGALTCCYLEMDRRAKPLAIRYGDDFGTLAGRLYADIIAPYEDIKIKANGDVY